MLFDFPRSHVSSLFRNVEAISEDDSAFCSLDVGTKGKAGKARETGKADGLLT
jgi:hypothetical protein